MGILGDQPIRPSMRVEHGNLDELLAQLVELAAKHKISVESVIEARRVLELQRANDIRNLSGDYHDEHMGGLGEILTRIADAAESRQFP